MTELSVNEDSSKFVISNTMPAILEKYRDRIEATIKPYLTLNLVENENLTRWQSKCAGWENSSGNFPYLPKGFDYPQTADGEYLHLFMQINCAEIPHLPGFPKQGILQFYLLGNNDQNLYSFGEQYWQQNYELLSPQSKWKVLYFPEPDFNPENLTTNFDFLLEKVGSDREPYPRKCSEIHCNIGYEAVPLCDYTAHQQLGLKSMDRQFYTEFITAYTDGWGESFAFDREDNTSKDAATCMGIMGGYSLFVNDDPREYCDSEADPFDTLLLRISLAENGALHFYTQSSALARGDFSNILYAMA